jgi:dephospho-CoA kinase
MEIARTWPAVVRGGVLDRAALAEIVFADPAARARLERILHPHIRRLALEREARAAPGQLCVHVVPLLFETGYGDIVDKSVLVVAPDAQRIARIAARDRIGEAQIRARMAAQIAPGEARRRANFVIENDGDLAHLRKQVRAVFNALV